MVLVVVVLVLVMVWIFIGNGIGSASGGGSGNASGAPANKTREDNEVEMGPRQIEAGPFQFQTFSVEIDINTSLCEVLRIAKYFT